MNGQIRITVILIHKIDKFLNRHLGSTISVLSSSEDDKKSSSFLDGCFVQIWFASPRRLEWYDHHERVSHKNHQ